MAKTPNEIWTEMAAAWAFLEAYYDAHEGEPIWDHAQALKRYIRRNIPETQDLRENEE